MGEALERLEVKLARTYVPPHSKTVAGKVVQVEGYWREGRAKASPLAEFEGGGSGETLTIAQAEAWLETDPAVPEGVWFHATDRDDWREGDRWVHLGTPTQALARFRERQKWDAKTVGPGKLHAVKVSPAVDVPSWSVSDEEAQEIARQRPSFTTEAFRYRNTKETQEDADSLLVPARGVEPFPLWSLA